MPTAAYYLHDTIRKIQRAQPLCAERNAWRMKATGIVRRIDELGRVVIPKEIRRTQRIRPGDPLEFFPAGEGEVIFR